MKCSVIIPAYNAERHLRKTIESINNQTITPSEVIIINDGSTDNTLAVASKISTEFINLNIKIVDQRNCGAAASRQVGVETATGDILVFTDADDISIPNRLEKFIQAFQDYPDSVAAFAKTQTRRDISRDDAKITLINDPISVYLGQNWPLAVAMNFAVKREVAQKATPVPRYFKAANDYAFQINIATQGSFTSVNATTLIYEPNQDGITKKMGIHTQRAYALIAAHQIAKISSNVKHKAIFNTRLTNEWIDILLHLNIFKNRSLFKDILFVGIKHSSYKTMHKSLWWALQKIINRK